MAFGLRPDPWPDKDDYRYAGETIRGRADWGDQESDYQHGFGAFRSNAPSIPPEYEGPGVVRRREPLWPDYTGRGPREYRRSDERIHEDVCDRLTEGPYVDAFEIEVHVQDGEVTLSGYVPSRYQKRAAEDIAASVSGVKDVINDLRVAPI